VYWLRSWWKSSAICFECERFRILPARGIFFMGCFQCGPDKQIVIFSFSFFQIFRFRKILRFENSLNLKILRFLKTLIQILKIFNLKTIQIWTSLNMKTFQI
jgi:hypothetical protein